MKRESGAPRQHMRPSPGNRGVGGAVRTYLPAGARALCPGCLKTASGPMITPGGYAEGSPAVPLPSRPGCFCAGAPVQPTGAGRRPGVGGSSPGIARVRPQVGDVGGVPAPNPQRRLNAVLVRRTVRNHPHLSCPLRAKWAGVRKGDPPSRACRGRPPLSVDSVWPKW